MWFYCDYVSKMLFSTKETWEITILNPSEVYEVDIECIH